MMYTVPSFIQQIFPSLVWRYVEADIVYLTFDDGPVPEATPYVLDLLREYNAKATFFCIGDNVRKYPKLYQRIIDEGHAVGNHTYSHVHGWKTADATYHADIERAARYIDSKLFRPPYGKLWPRQAKAISQMYDVVMWDVLSGDYNPQLTAEQCLHNVTKHAKAGSVIVFHDSVKAIGKLKAILPSVLQYCKYKEWLMAPITTNRR